MRCKVHLSFRAETLRCISRGAADICLGTFTLGWSVQHYCIFNIWLHKRINPFPLSSPKSYTRDSERHETAIFMPCQTHEWFLSWNFCHDSPWQETPLSSSMCLQAPDIKHSEGSPSTHTEHCTASHLHIIIIWLFLFFFFFFPETRSFLTSNVLVEPVPTHWLKLMGSWCYGSY